MEKYQRLLKWIVLGFLVIVLAACTQSESPDLDLARTYAAQTLTALPTDALEDTEIPTQAVASVTSTATPTKVFTPTPQPTLAPVGPGNFPENVNPLTGLEVEDPTILDRRPVFVKVANYPASGRPHAGLSFADMVFEYYIGYGSNRFMAAYYGEDSTKIGPVRSGRLVDAEIVNLYEGILGFESAYVTVLDYIRSVLGVRAISGEVCPAICDEGQNIVTSVFANSEALTTLSDQRGVDNRRYTLDGMAFDPQAPAGGQPGDQALIIYSNLNRGEWRFDEESGSYLRWIEDTTGQELQMIPLVDRETGEQLAFSNVVVLFAYHTELAASLYEIDIWNSVGQRAVVFRDGQAYDITWTTPVNNQPIQFIGQDGNIFPLKHGNTWVVILGIYSGVNETDGAWTFNFKIP